MHQLAPRIHDSKKLLLHIFTTSVNHKPAIKVLLIILTCVLVKTEICVAQNGTLKTLQPMPVIYTNLMEVQPSGLYLADGVGVGFGSQFSAVVDNDDAAKLWNFDENIAIIRNAHALAIEFRPLPVLVDTFVYRLYLKQQPYAIKIVSQNFAGLTIRGWLIDKYLHTKTSVNLTDTTIYKFTPNSDTNSYRNRFMLVLNRQLDANSIPVTKLINQNNFGQTGIANSIAATQGNVSVYPNPVRNITTMLQFKNMVKGNYLVMVYNANGQQLKQFAISHNGGNAAYTVEMNSQWANGIYTIRISNSSLQNVTALHLQIDR